MEGLFLILFFCSGPKSNLRKVPNLVLLTELISVPVSGEHGSPGHLGVVTELPDEDGGDTRWS